MPGIGKAIGNLMKSSLASSYVPSGFHKVGACGRFSSLSVSFPSTKRAAFQLPRSTLGSYQFLRSRGLRSQCMVKDAGVGFEGASCSHGNNVLDDSTMDEPGKAGVTTSGADNTVVKSDAPVVEAGVQAEDNTKEGDATVELGVTSDVQQAVSGSVEQYVEDEQQKTRSKSQGQPRRTRGPMPDLLKVKGIGPRNLEKLVSKGIGNLGELKQLYRDKFRSGGLDTVVSYLVESVGVHKNHANVIASFIKEAVEKEISSENAEAPKPKKRFTFCVEGNISVGKTTFLQRIANETVELRDLVEVVPEPIGKWQDVGKHHHNVLDAFYAAPARYAYTFQNYVFVTRLMQERESANGLKPLRLMERSVFSDKMVFVRAVHEAKWMSDMELNIYESWFDPVVAELPGLVPDGFIYLRASPDACHKRLQMRKRPEEQKVTLDYLQDLHEKHEQWLFPSTTGTGSVLSLKEWPLKVQQPPSGIKDRVFYLEGDHVHSCIRKVPALVLDCEASIDFTRDIEAKAAYARQVADFFEYVKQSAEKRSDNLVLPSAAAAMRSPGILGPDGLLLHH